MKSFISRLNSLVVNRIVPGTESPPAKSRSSILALLSTALWFGLATGLLEMSLCLGQKLWDNRVTVASIRTNWHWIWMVPVSNVMVFAACGLLLGILVRFRPRLRARFAPYLLCFLGWLALLLTFKGLYLVADVILAAGLAAVLAPLIKTRALQFRRLVRLSTPPMAIVVVLLIAIVGSQIALEERRAEARLPKARPGSPNVLLIVMDDLRADDLSLYQYHRNTSPNLVRLASRGIRFDEARSTAPWTLPSHASMFTGRWPHELSAAAARPLDATFPTVAEFLAGHGYDTAGFVGNTFYCNSWYGLNRGFTHYEDFYENRVVSVFETFRSSTLGHSIVTLAGVPTATSGAKDSRKTAAMINRDALAWLSQRGDRPFFVFLNYFDVHSPFQPPDDFDLHFGLSAEPLAEREALLLKYARLSYRKKVPADSEAIVRKARTLLRDSYDSCIAYLDDQIGRLFNDLERRGLLANTLVIVTSDHGEQFGEQQLVGHGNSLYRPLIHVPLLVFPPSGASPGRVVREPVSLRNLPATMVDLLNLRESSPFPGQSLARHWTSDRAPAGDSNDPLLSEVEHQKLFVRSPVVPASMGPLQSLVGDSRVYIRNSDGREQLYDLENDPLEVHDLAGTTEAPPILKRFRHELTRILGEKVMR